jgi:hypothetical protein
MVRLLSHIHSIQKSNGRKYFYYAKHRCRVDAWPRIALPHDPLSVEFAVRVRQCERLSTVRSNDGTWTWSFIDARGRIRAVPSPIDPNFWAALDRADEDAKKVSVGELKTFAALVAEYRESDAWRRLAEGSRQGYEIYLSAIEAVWADDPVSALTAVDAQKAIDSYNKTPAAARYFRSVLSRLIAYGIPRGYSKDNPVAHTEKPADGGTYSPWPDWAFEIFFEHARVGLHLTVYTGLYTGQRSVDVLAMVRPRPQATEMLVVQQKTDVRAPVQIHSEYRRILDAAFPVDDKIIALRDDKPLHLREDGEPWTLAGWKTAWQREITFEAPSTATPTDREKAKAMKRLRDARVVYHGLRKNAVINLLEVGCSEDEVGAIVGMSAAMVRHYGREVRKHKLALNAMRKLELGWAGLKLIGESS